MTKLPRKFDMRPKQSLPHNEPEYIVMPKSKLVDIPKKLSYKAIIPFMAGILILSLAVQSMSYLSHARNAQGEILGAATSAYDDLTGASSSLSAQNFQDAQTRFTSALTNLNAAQTKLDDFKALQLVAPQAKSADHVLSGASLLAQAGGKLTQGLTLFDELKVSSKGVETDNVLAKLSQNRDLFAQSLTLLNQATYEFNSVSNLPGSYAETLTKAKDQTQLLAGMLTDLVNLEDIYLGFFGNGPKVYLLLFQNYDEARATGGFIGTYGVIKINGGKIQDLKIDSIYDLDGHIYDNVAAPGPFQPDIKKWGIRDANWFADFPTSARKLLQFFESGSQTADGVIAFTPEIFKDLLTLTGPIEMKNYGVTLTADNFQDVVQYKTSYDYNKTLNDPKAMLSDFAPILLDRLSSLDRNQWLSLLQIMQNNLNQKHALLYSKDPNLEQKIQDLRIAGNILPSDQDYLNIVNTNLGGTKTDLKMEQKAELSSKILSDGSIIDTLTIQRTNTSNQVNRDFLRVLVPHGSTLVSSGGFDPGVFNSSEAQGYKTDPDLAAWDQGEQHGHIFVRTESGKTEFSGWLSVEGQTSKTITLVYVIPYQLSLNVISNNSVYSLLFQKQNGVLPYDFSASVDMGSQHQVWTTSDVNFDSGVLKFNYTTGSDQYWAALLTK